MAKPDGPLQDRSEMAPLPKRSVRHARSYEAELPRLLDVLERGVGVAASPALVGKLHRRFDPLGDERAKGTIARLCDLPPDHDEWCDLAAALLNHETCCMRDLDQFELVSSVLPDLIERADRDGSRVLRAWSAGCSTGEEAWSLAVLLAQGLVGAQRAIQLGTSVVLSPSWQIEVIGSDLSHTALETARAATYSTRAPSAFRRMTDEHLSFFLRDEDARRRCIDPSLRAFVHFERRNIARAAPPPGRFDIVVCRNVLPYLTTSARRQVAAALLAKLKPGSCLLTGPTDLPDEFAGLDIVWSANAMIYRKDSAVDAAGDRRL